jgi:aminopeptidase
MPDRARLRQVARLLVRRSLAVRPRWQVVIRAHVAALPLVQEVERELARAGAWPILQLRYDALGAWEREVPEELLAEPPPIWQRLQEEGDAFLAIFTPPRPGPDAPPPERLARLAASHATLQRRMTDMDVPWTLCLYPTADVAAEAGMPLAQLEELLFGACLRDWDAERIRMERIAERVDAASEVRIVAPGTDLRLSVRGRTCAVDDGRINVPGGEVYVSPCEDATEGIVTFGEFPACYLGQRVEGAWLRFADGRVVDAGAAVNEAFLVDTLETDDGARILGELGIGCNAALTRYTRNPLLDEKIGGTVHLALGASYAKTGGRNRSAIHWDIVKDLRHGGELWLDGRLAQRDGAWLEAVGA